MEIEKIDLTLLIGKIKDFYLENAKNIALTMAIISEIVLYMNYIEPLQFYNNIDIILLMALFFLTIFRKNLASIFLLVLIGLPFFALHPLYALLISLALFILYFAIERNISVYYIITIISFTFAWFGSAFVVIPFAIYLTCFAKESKLFSLSYPILLAVLFMAVQFNENFIERMNTVLFVNLDQMQALFNDSLLLEAALSIESSRIQSTFLYAVIIFIITKGIAVVLEEYYFRVQRLLRPVLLCLGSILFITCFYIANQLIASSQIVLSTQFFIIVTFGSVLSVSVAYFLKNYKLDQEELDKIRFDVIEPAVEQIIVQKSKRTKEEEFIFLSPIAANLNSILNSLLNETLKEVSMQCFGKENWFSQVQKIMNANPRLFTDPTSMLDYQDLDASKTTRLLTDKAFPLLARTKNCPGLLKNVENSRQARNNIAHNNFEGGLDISYLYILSDCCDKLRAALFNSFPETFSVTVSEEYLRKIKQLTKQLKEL